MLDDLRVGALYAVHDAIAKLLELFTPGECRNYLVNSGYAST